MSRGTLVGLADLARLLEAEPDAFKDIIEAKDILRRAESLGYKARPPQLQIPLPKFEEEKAGTAASSPVDTPDLQPQRMLEAPFWIAATFEERKIVTQHFEPQLSVEPVVWRGAPTKAPENHPLSSPQSLKPRLRELLAPLSKGRDIDVPRMVDHVAYGKPLQNPPRRERRRWPTKVWVLFDRTAHLSPFFDDQDNVFALLEEMAHGMNVDSINLTTGDLRTASGDLIQDLQIGDDDTVLLLSDLGSLSSSRNESALLWSALGYRLRDCGARVVALTPGPVSLVDAWARTIWQVQAWDAATRWAKTDRQARNSAVEYLLVLTSFLTRIQTGLLRDLRLAFRSDFDAGIEAEFWDHTDLHNAGALWARSVFRGEEGKETIYQTKFRALSSVERQKAWDIIGRWRFGLRVGVVCQEIVSLGDDTVSAEDADDAKRYFSNLAAEYTIAGPGDKKSYCTEAWLQRVKREGTAALFNREEIQYLISATRERDPSIVAEGPIRLAHTGAIFQIFSAEQPSAIGSSLCVLPSGNGQLQIQPLEDHTFWARGVAPAWAANWGADEFGLWVSFRLDADNGAIVEQRLRWMPAGTFMMGSPADETGRYDDESPQHEVTFEQGFWMFETAVTQELWSAVMDHNPSKFAGSRLPVEQVSWDEAKEFIERLNSRLPGLELRLPSEAEWEYSCRAGTETAYSFGETITKEQVNFEYNVGQTVEVASLPPNGWGLYEMHGNVDEWYEDIFQDSYQGAPTDGSAWVDAEDDASAAYRVIRGGSWDDDARDVRSAFRGRYEPSSRISVLGFRCARGPVRAQPASAEKPGRRASSARRERSGAMQTMPAEPIGLELGRNPTREPPKAERLLVQSDRAAITLERMLRPDWASGMGRDQYGLYAEFEIKTVTQRLRWIPPGTFMMGSPDNEPGRYDYEGPQHHVQISEGYWLFSTPVTQALYEAVVGENPSHFKSPDRPVEQVSFEDAGAFLKQINGRLPGLGLRLPSEAEWEYACRAGTNTATYAGPMEILGDNNAPILDDIAWYGGNSGVDFDLEDGYDSSEWKEKQYEHTQAGTRRVGLKRPNALGLYDMLGNVWEWCEDIWQESYEGAPADGSAWLDAEDASAAGRVIRGGSWLNDAQIVRSAYRNRNEPSYRFNFLGFRCARGRDK